MLLVTADPPPPPGALPPLTAQVSIDGKDMGLTHAVNCNQTG
ncbi:MAG TPA: hypothetical protein VET27_14010 [Mycobacterium sp.]|nr:hypothetical protein [Mycobacterium sp.]